MNDELKNVEEIVRNLHECACEGCPADILDAADLIDSLAAQLTASQRREKAAAEDINLLEDCGVCKHHDLDSCDLVGTECHFEWRGPQEAEKGSNNGN